MRIKFKNVTIKDNKNKISHKNNEICCNCGNSTLRLSYQSYGFSGFYYCAYNCTNCNNKITIAHRN